MVHHMMSIRQEILTTNQRATENLQDMAQALKQNLVLILNFKGAKARKEDHYQTIWYICPISFNCLDYF